MTELNKNSSLKDSHLADFLFTLNKSKDKIKLVGIEGIIWNELSFTLSINQKRIINQNGALELN